MDKNVNVQSQTVVSSPKFNVELCSQRVSPDKCDVVLVRRENVDFSVVTAFLAIMSAGQYVAISFPKDADV